MTTTINNLKQIFTKKSFIFSILCISICFTVLLNAVVKYPSTEINYKNSDATWHTLLTIQAYDETPISVHKFLPIVSLGKNSDKYIPWGATIPDKKGNYYYTSFSPMGFFMPWIFAKIFHLPHTEFTLYLFNTLLLCLSCWIILCLFKELFGNKISSLALFSVMYLYILSPEIEHGMGICYWHQSLMQVFLPLQCLFYLRYIKYGNSKALKIFLCMCILNPYAEWSGYVANVGFFIAEIVRCWGKSLKSYVVALFIALATMLSLTLFILHYLITVDAIAFFDALQRRFLARNVTNSVPLTLLFKGYWESFAALISLVGIFVFIILVSRQPIKFEKYKYLMLLITFFPLIENIVMKQHAIGYTYDRMKLALPLLLIICLCFEIVSKKETLTNIMAILIFLIYIAFPYNSKNYIWHIDYRHGNEKLSEYIETHFNNSICGFSKSVRGYLNMTIKRGCYEFVQSFNSLTTKAIQQKANFIVLLDPEFTMGKDAWNMYKLSANVYDTETGNIIKITNNGQDISITEKVGKIVAAEITDKNWNKGIKKDGQSVILLPNLPHLKSKIARSNEIICNKNKLKITYWNSDDKWARVKVDGDASSCAYPMEINFN